ncbi:MAG: YaeQ family protein, partial [Elusimicrobiota bacterium]
MFPLKIRADLQVNSASRKLVLAAVENETPEHLGLKLAAYLLFWDEELIVDPGLKTAALTGQSFRPDLLGSDITGSVATWVECGNTSDHKLGKVLRRWPEARVVVLKEHPRGARAYRETLQAKVGKSERVRILCWPDGAFVEWMRCLSEKTEIVGEANDSSLNLVVNEQLCMVDMLKC